MGQQILMQPPLPMPCTFPMLPCSPGRFHNLPLCWLFYRDWTQWKRAGFMLFTESLISFSCKQENCLQGKARTYLIFQPMDWTQTSKEWGACSPSQGFHSLLQAEIKPLTWNAALSEQRQANASWVLFHFFLHIPCHYYDITIWGGRETTSPGKAGDLCIRLGASGHFLGTWQQEQTEMAAQYGQMFFPLTPCRVHICWMIYSLFSEPKEKSKHCWLQSDFAWPLK